jgi:hypothetical protein
MQLSRSPYTQNHLFHNHHHTADDYCQRCLFSAVFSMCWQAHWRLRSTKNFDVSLCVIHKDFSEYPSDSVLLWIAGSGWSKKKLSKSQDAILKWVAIVVKVFFFIYVIFPQISLGFHHVKSNQQNVAVSDGIDSQKDAVTVGVQSQAVRD